MTLTSDHPFGNRVMLMLREYKKGMQDANKATRWSDVEDIIQRAFDGEGEAPAPAKKARSIVPVHEKADRIYMLYPRKVAPDSAKRAITIALKSIPFEELEAKTMTYADCVDRWPRSLRYTSTGSDTVPHPATWFNRGSYNDDPREWKKGFGGGKPQDPVLVPMEPAGWRDQFPDFIERDKAWNEIEPFSRDHIIKTMKEIRSK